MKFLKFFPVLLVVLCSQKSYCQSFRVKHTEHSANLESVAFSFDGKRMASGDWNGTINLYTLDSNNYFRLTKSMNTHLSAVTTLSFSKNGKFLVSSSKDFTIKVFNLDTAGKDKSFSLHSQPITAAFLDPSNKYLISSSTDGTVKTTSVHNPKKTRELKPGGPVTDVVISKDFKFYFVALKGGTIKKFESAGKNAEVASFVGHSDDVNDIEISPDGKFLASASNDKTIIIWDLNTNKQIKKLSGFEWKVTAINISSDSKYIVGACNDGVVKLFEIESGKTIAEFKEMGKNARNVSLLRDGSQIAVATHMDGEKFGAVIYNTGISIAVSEPGGPGAKGKAGSANNAKTTTTDSKGQKSNSNTNKKNGSK